jgi:hypothetical protein
MGAKTLASSKRANPHKTAQELLVGRMITDIVFDDDTGRITVRMDTGSFMVQGEALEFYYKPTDIKELH